MPKKYKEFEVNGSKIGVYPMHEVEAVEIMMDFKAGSRYEKGKKWGAMHLLEHMVHEGTNHFPKRDDIENYKERYGISSNASTGGASMRFWFRFPSQSLDAVFKLIEEVVFKPTIPDNVLEREKNVISQEYRDKWSNPHRRFSYEVDKFLFGKEHPYTRDGMGQPEYVQSISSETLRAIHNKFIVPTNLFIGVAGKVDSKSIKKHINALLKDKPVGKKMHMLDKPVVPRKSYFWHKEDVEHTVINVDWFIPGYDELSLKEEEMFRLAKHILGGSPLSLLFNKLRQELGIAYSGGASFGTFPAKGYFGANTSTDFKNIILATETMQKVVKDFLLNGVQKSRFYQAKKFKDMQLMLSYDSVGGIANSLAYDLFYFDRIIPLNEHRKILGSISQEDMLKFVRKYLSEKPYISVMAKMEPDL